MSVAVLPLEFERIRKRTHHAMGYSAIAHVVFLVVLAQVLSHQHPVADTAVEVTWLDPAKVKPAPAPAPAAKAEPAAAPKPAPAKAPAAAPKPAPAAPAPPPVPRGTAGRERAQQATTALAAATASIDGVLEGLDDALESSTDAPATTRRVPRRNAIRGGRAASELGGVGGLPAAGVAGDGASALGGARIEIGAIGGVSGGDGDGAFGASTDGSAAGHAGGSSRGDLRSDASLLAVVRKYAPGIRFCYENELKKKPGLGGKLVVAITVAAAGNVTEAAIVQDTLGSASLTACALAQIQAWRFPAIPEGVVTFRAPFVFTPPE
jgi:TonB family protein